MGHWIQKDALSSSYFHISDCETRLTFFQWLTEEKVNFIRHLQTSWSEFILVHKVTVYFHAHISNIPVSATCFYQLLFYSKQNVWFRCVVLTSNWFIVDAARDAWQQQKERLKKVMITSAANIVAILIVKSVTLPHFQIQI